MDTLKQFFTDKQLFYDSERQCRALEMAVTLRETEPLSYIECRPLGQLFDAIQENLKTRFAASELSSLKRSASGLRGPGLGIEPAQTNNPIMAGIFGCFEGYMDDAHDALQQDGTKCRAGSTLEALLEFDSKVNRTQEELQQDLCMLVTPLCRFVYVTLSKGIYLTTSTDETRDVHAIESMLQSLSNLFLNTLPRLLFNFSTDVQDPVRFEFNSESVCLMMKAVVESLSALVALVHYHEKYGPIILIRETSDDEISAQNALEHVLPSNTDYSRVVKLSSLDHILFSIGKAIVPALGEYLLQCNKFLASMHIVTNVRWKPLQKLNAALSTINLSILFFLHELLAITYVDSAHAIYQPSSVSIDDTVGTTRTKSFRKINNSANPYANEFLRKRTVSKNEIAKTATDNYKTREEVHECILSVMFANKIVDQILLFLQAPENSRPYLLALSILQILPFERMNHANYSSAVLARLCVEQFRHYFIVKKHNFSYKRLHRKEIDLQLSYLNLISRASQQKSPFIATLCEGVRLCPDKGFLNKLRKTSTLDPEAEPDQLTFNFVSDYIIELISLYGRHEFHPVRHALVYLNGPAQLEAIMQASTAINRKTLVFGKNPIGTGTTMTGQSFSKDLVNNTAGGGENDQLNKSTQARNSVFNQPIHPISGPSGPFGLKSKDLAITGGLAMFGTNARNTPVQDSGKGLQLGTLDHSGRTALITKACAGAAAAAMPRTTAKHVVTSKVRQNLVNNYLYVARTANTVNETGEVSEATGAPTQRYKPIQNFRSNVPEGYTVNYIELNKQRLFQGKIVEENYRRQVELVAQQDLEEDYYIMHSKDIPNHMRAVKMYEALEEREKRNRRMFNACKAKIYTDMRKGMSVIMANGTYENEHFDDCVAIKNKESLMGQLAAAMGNGPLDSNFTLVTNSLDQIDPVYEVLYIYHSIVILRNLVQHSSTMADNKTRSILATIKPDLLRALVYFVSVQNPVLLPVALDLLFSIITFPGGLSEYLQYGIDLELGPDGSILTPASKKKEYATSVWEILIYSEFITILCGMITRGQMDALLFLLRFFQRPTTQNIAVRSAAALHNNAESNSYESMAPIALMSNYVVKNFVAFIDPLVHFFYTTSDVELQQVSLTAISFLCFSCGSTAKPLIGNYISEQSLDVLSGTIIDVLRTPNHFNTLAAVVTAYSVFATPKDSHAATMCLESNVLMSICDTFVARFSGANKDSEKSKLTYVDVITLRFLMDILSSGNERILSYLRENTALQSAVCKLYRKWLQTNKIMHVDENTLVLLPGTERKAAMRNIPRGCFYDLSADFIQTVSALPRANSPVNIIESLRSGSARTATTSRGKPTKNLVYQYSNLVAIQTQICETVGNDESFEITDLFQNKDVDVDVDGNTMLSPSVTLTELPVSASGGDENEKISRRVRICTRPQSQVPSNYHENFSKGKRGASLCLSGAPNYKEWFQPLLDAPTVDKSPIELPAEVVDIMLLDFTSLVLSFFRALYPELASLDCKVTKYEPRNESLLKSALTQASIRSEASSRPQSLASTKGLTNAVSDLNLSSLVGPAVSLPSLASTTVSTAPPTLPVIPPLTGNTAKSGVTGLGLGLGLGLPKLGDGKLDIDLSMKSSTPARDPEVVLHLPTDDVLTIIAMLGYGLKETLAVYEKTADVGFTAADRQFITECASRVEQRILSLSEQGAALVQKKRDSQLGEEAEYYSSMLK